MHFGQHFEQWHICIMGCLQLGDKLWFTAPLYCLSFKTGCSSGYLFSLPSLFLIPSHGYNNYLKADDSWISISGSDRSEYQRKGEKNIETIVSHLIKWLRGTKRVVRWDDKVEMMWFMCNSHISNTSVIKQQSYHTLSCPFINQISKMLTVVIKKAELMLFNCGRHPSRFILR